MHCNCPFAGYPQWLGGESLYTNYQAWETSARCGIRLSVVFSRFVHWRTAAMAQSVPELVSSCKKGDFQYKATFLELPKHFNFNVLISSQPPEAQAVLEAVSLICHDCGQRKDSNASNPGSNQNFCNDCFEEKAQATPPWVTILPRH